MMTVRTLRCCLLLAAVVMIAGGCASGRSAGGASVFPVEEGKARKAERVKAEDFADFFREEARQRKSSGDFRGALDGWRMVAAFEPGDNEASGHIRELESGLAKEAEGHYQRGRSLHRKGDVPGSRKEMIKALTADPDHGEALLFVRELLAPESFTLEISDDDTFEEIARRAYGDPSLGELIAFASAFDGSSDPLPGGTLSLPLLEEGWTRPGRAETVSAPSEASLARARDYLEYGSYQRAVQAAESAVDTPALRAEAREVINEASFELGGELADAERYAEALRAYEKVDPGYRDIEKVLAELEEKKRKSAEEHYLAGVRCAIDEELEKAIAEWEITLTIDPNHSKAARDIEKYRGLLESLKSME